MNPFDEGRYPAQRRRLRLGFVGGGIGAQVSAWHALGARISNRWDIVAGALSPDPQRARLSGEQWMLAPDRIYADFRSMAAAEGARPDGIDAVAICTPNVLHREVAEAFLRAGIDIIFDKPMTTTLDDALAVMQLQRQTGLVFGITHPYSYHAMVRQAREMIRDGLIGRVRQAHVEYFQEWETASITPDMEGFRRAQWRRDPARVGRAATTADIGTHAFHLLYHVTGETIAELRAEFHLCGAQKPMEDTAFMTLRLGNGAPGTLMVTQAAPGNYCALRIRVFGEKGGIEWDQEKPEYLQVHYLNEPARTIVRGTGSGVNQSVNRLVHMPRGHGEALSDAWGNLYTELAVAISARRENAMLPADFLTVSDALDGARGVKFVEAAVESHDAGGAWTPCWLDA